jgi:very-short-patch-repair endonuclease
MTVCKICNQDKDSNYFYRINRLTENTCKECQATIRKQNNSHRKHRLKTSNSDNKICAKCLLEKPKSEFYYIEKTRKYCSKCKECNTKSKEKINVKLYTCHICGLVSKLNCLLGQHYKKHADVNPKQYKEDLLTHNDRPPNICPVCNKKTSIPKGEYEYPKYHKECYNSHLLQGENNPNYKNAQITAICCECGKEVIKFKSQQNKKPFCSISCGTRYWSKPENQSEVKKVSMKKASELIQKMNHDPIAREKMAKNKALAFKDRCSKLELSIYKKIKEAYPTAKHGCSIGWYTVDILLDNIVIEVQGDYWHSLSNVVSQDKRKKTYLTNKGYHVIYIWEHEWNGSNNQDILIKSIIDPVIQFSSLANQPSS